MPYITRRRRPAESSIGDDVAAPAWFNTGPDSVTVHEPEARPEPTGLLDMHGNEICRVRERVPMGFRKP